MIWSHESSDCKRRGIWPAVGLCCALGYERTRDSQSDSGHDFSLWLDILSDTPQNKKLAEHLKTVGYITSREEKGKRLVDSDPGGEKGQKILKIRVKQVK